MHMNAVTIELYVAISILLVLLAILSAAALRFCIRNNASASKTLLKTGTPILGATVLVSTLNASFLLPWKKLPATAQLQGWALLFFWAARLFAWGSAISILIPLASQSIGVA